jgi:L-iditol 2-dehydrogenase
MFPFPEPAHGQALVRVTDCGICGSDVRYFHGENPWALHTLGREIPNPENMILGARGGRFRGCRRARASRRSRSAKRVGVLAFKCDATCYWCRRGEEQLCPDMMHLGHAAGWGESDYYYGGMAEYVPVWAEHCYELPDSVSNEAAAMLDPMGVALHGVRRAGIRPGESVLVIGGGPIGMFCVQIAKALGAGFVACSDLDTRILELAGELGADAVINASKEDPTDTVMHATAGRGADMSYSIPRGWRLRASLKASRARRQTDAVRRPPGVRSPSPLSTSQASARSQR